MLLAQVIVALVPNSHVSFGLPKEGTLLPGEVRHSVFVGRREGSAEGREKRAEQWARASDVLVPLSLFENDPLAISIPTTV